MCHSSHVSLSEHVVHKYDLVREDTCMFIIICHCSLVSLSEHVVHKHNLLERERLHVHMCHCSHVLLSEYGVHIANGDVKFVSPNDSRHRQ